MCSVRVLFVWNGVWVKMRSTRMSPRSSKDWFVNNSMEQSPYWEANSSSSTQEIPRIPYNQNVHYHIHNIPALFSIPSQKNPIYVLTAWFILTSIISTILPSMPRSSQQSISLIFHPSYPCMHISSSPTFRLPHPSQPPWVHHPNNTKYKTCNEGSSYEGSYLYFLVTCSLLRRNAFLRTLFSNAHSPHTSVNGSYQVSDPQKAAYIIMALYNITLAFVHYKAHDEIILRLGKSNLEQLKLQTLYRIHSRIPRTTVR